MSASEKILNGAISSGTSAMKQQSTVSSSSYEPAPPPVSTYETYRPPPPISHERINPFDKNKPASVAPAAVPIVSSSFSYTPPSSTFTSAVPITSTTTQVFKPDLTATSDFDYSYKPTIPSTVLSNVTQSPSPLLYSSRDSVDKAVPEVSSDFKRPVLERKLSDADIIFGAKPAAPDYSSFKYASGYSRNRSNSSFTSSTTDSDYMYGNRDAKRENSFQKSISVSSDKDGDFSHDPEVLFTRSGIQNDAFSDFDSPAAAASSTSGAHQSWSNNDDDYDLK